MCNKCPAAHDPQHVTTTHGTWSSAPVNLQNLPRRDEDDIFNAARGILYGVLMGLCFFGAVVFLLWVTK